MKETRIVTEYGTISKIAKIFRVSTLTVRKALRGDVSVRNYAKIRKCAIENGAKEMTEVNNI